jgi:hypothetical protein
MAQAVPYIIDCDKLLSLLADESMLLVSTWRGKLVGVQCRVVDDRSWWLVALVRPAVASEVASQLRTVQSGVSFTVQCSSARGMRQGLAFVSVLGNESAVHP